jgi:hypothetical protein
MRKAKLTLAAGIALIGAVGAWTFTGSPPRVVSVSGRPANTTLGYTIGNAAICQGNETLPGGVSAVRLSMIAFIGSNVRVIAYNGSRALTEGRHGPTWMGTSVTVPVEPVDRTTSDVTLCLALGPTSERVEFPGRRTSARAAALTWRTRRTPTPALAASEGEPLPGRMGVEYLASGRSSWWSLALSVARHMGIGHFVRGTWVALLVVALMAGVGLLALALTLRELR